MRKDRNLRYKIPKKETQNILPHMRTTYNEGVKIYENSEMVLNSTTE